MSEEQWTAVDLFAHEHLLGKDEALESALATNTKEGLRAIDVSPAQGRFLEILAQLMGAKRALEIGTLGGYSTICLARGVGEGGRVVTLEIEEKHARVARGNLAHAGLAERVELRLAPAADSLAALIAEKVAPFDLVFIDADKRSNPAYVRAALELTRPGAAILVDNTVREGAILDATSKDADVVGVRTLFAEMGADKRLRATNLQIVGTKGWDGFILARRV